jgi:hypothetical protein
MNIFSFIFESIFSKQLNDDIIVNDYTLSKAFQ